MLYAKKRQQNSFTFKKERHYQSLADNLAKFDELGKLPRTLQLDRIDEGQGIQAAIEAKWHKTCRLL